MRTRCSLAGVSGGKRDIVSWGGGRVSQVERGAGDTNYGASKRKNRRRSNLGEVNFQVGHLRNGNSWQCETGGGKPEEEYQQTTT